MGRSFVVAPMLIVVILAFVFVCLGIGKVISHFAEKADKKLDERLEEKHRQGDR